MTSARPKLIGWRTVVVCVLVGLALNVLTAWGLTVWLRIGDPGAAPHLTTMYRASDAMAPIEVGPQSVDPTIAWPAGAPSVRDAPAAAMGRWHWPSRPGADSRTWWSSDSATVVTAWRAGFPVRSFQSFAHLRANGKGSWGAIAHAWGIDMGRGCEAQPQLGDTIHLPLRPMWGGVAVNTLFYAGLVLAPVVALRWARRARRRGRGLCIGCGYELAGLGACPECGVAAPGALCHDRGRGG